MSKLSKRLAGEVRIASRRLWQAEDGQTMVEYGLLVAGIALIIIAALIILGPDIANLFKETASSVKFPLGPPPP